MQNDFTNVVQYISHISPKRFHYAANEMNHVAGELQLLSLLLDKMHTKYAIFALWGLLVDLNFSNVECVTLATHKLQFRIYIYI